MEENLEDDFREFINEKKDIRCCVIICSYYSVDEELAFNVGDILSEDDMTSFGNDVYFSPKLATANASLAADPNPTTGLRYYHAYVLDVNNKVLARAKTVVDIPLDVEEG